MVTGDSRNSNNDVIVMDGGATSLDNAKVTCIRFRYWPSAMSKTVNEVSNSPIRRIHRYERCFFDLATVDKQIKAISPIRGRRSLTKEERIDILQVFLTVHRETLVSGSVVQTYKKTAQLLRRSTRTIRDVVKISMEVQSYHEDAFRSRGRPGNKTRKRTRISDDLETNVCIRDFVSVRRMNRERVSARKILDFVIEQGIIEVPKDETGRITKKGLSTGLRCVQRYLQRRGYKQGKAKRVSVSDHHIAWRNRYLKKLKEIRSVPIENRL